MYDPFVLNFENTPTFQFSSKLHNTCRAYKPLCVDWKYVPNSKNQNDNIVSFWSGTVTKKRVVGIPHHNITDNADTGHNCGKAARKTLFSSK